MIKPISQKQTKMSKNLKLLILNDLMILGTYRLKIF